MGNEVNIVKCKNGHFFDGDIYDSCPKCGEIITETSNNDNDVKSFQKGLKFNFVHKKKKKNNSSPCNEREQKDHVEFPNPTSDPPITYEPKPVDDFYNDMPKSEKIEVELAEETNNTEAFWDISKASSSGFYDENPKFGRQKEPIPVSNDQNPKEDLTDIVRQASASNDGKTVSYFNRKNQQQNNSENLSLDVSDPVVGWLVCVSGRHLGESFCIYTGNNSIGRNDSNKIVLNKDMAISREKHTSIFFEPREKNFYIQQTNELTYLNGTYVSSNIELKKWDQIDIGDSKFLIVPLCGEEFDWECYYK